MTVSIGPGDTLRKLAQQRGTTVEQLMKANELANPNMIRAGDFIALPMRFE